MNEMGTARRIDQLGRVVVPAELRRALAIRAGDLLDMRADRGSIVVRKINMGCALCGAGDDLVEVRERLICGRCVEAVSLV